ncbi:MAG: hypothetical protein QMD10_11690 [Desulfitobacteriaceae bacterium]|nr:hypothetical protein [Desulfitobacteriaceae bacterium]
MEVEKEEERRILLKRVFPSEKLLEIDRRMQMWQGLHALVSTVLGIGVT